MRNFLRKSGPFAVKNIQEIFEKILQQKKTLKFREKLLFLDISKWYTCFTKLRAKIAIHLKTKNYDLRNFFMREFCVN